jgi:hypothetical protein
MTEAFTKGNTQLTVTATTIKKVYAFAETINLVSLILQKFPFFRSFVLSHHINVNPHSKITNLNYTKSPNKLLNSLWPFIISLGASTVT